MDIIRVFKKTMFLIGALGLSTSIAYGSFFNKILGSSPKETSAKVGAFAYHYASPESRLFFPFADITFKNSLMLNAFQNSYNNFSASIGIKRYWFSYQLSPKLTWESGYGLGITYGYCQKRLDCADHSFPAIPAALAFTQLYFSKHIGVYAILAGTVVSSGLTFRW